MILHKTKRIQVQNKTFYTKNNSQKPKLLEIHFEANI